jgi:predicted nucleotidyltransferase component of viral defense system
MSSEPRGRSYHEDTHRFRAALAQAEAVTGFSSRLVEKDYYCSLLLHDLSGAFDQGLVFKGGTCLSKVHAEFFRLSEDLDFCVSIAAADPASRRRQAVSPHKDHFAGIPGRIASFRIVDPLTGHHSSRQYTGRFAYVSVVTGENDFIKFEISLRETILLPTEILPARTVLLDPDSNQPVLAPVDVRVLSLREAYAEKIRAALTRKEPAIRDYFDIDYALLRGLFNHRDETVLHLIAEKLSVAGNNPVDISDAKVTTLRGQIEGQLKPVLRAADFARFDLQRVTALLVEVVSLCPRK